VIPPLAALHISGKQCGGLGDIFYVSAVIIKQLVDSNDSTDVLVSGLTTLITLTSDSGLHREAESHMVTALSLHPDDASLRFRSVLMTPAVYEDMPHLIATRKLLTERLDKLYTDIHTNSSLRLTKLDEFTLSPTFYFVYQVINTNTDYVIDWFVDT
jgi:hypothetical protein